MQINFSKTNIFKPTYVNFFIVTNVSYIIVVYFFFMR